MLSMLPDHIITKSIMCILILVFAYYYKLLALFFLLDSNHQKVVVCSIKFGFRNTDIYR